MASLLLAIAASVSIPHAAAQSETPASPAEATAAAVATIEQVQARIQELEAATGIDEQEKARLLDAYRGAKARLEAAQASDEATAKFRQLIETGPAQLEKLRAELEKAKSESAARTRGTDAAGAESLEQTLTKVQADVASLSARAGELEKSVAALQSRPAAARDQLAAARTALGEIERQRAAAATVQASAELRAAQSVLLDARRRARTAEVAMLEAELLSIEIRGQLLNAERELVAARLAQTQSQAKALQERLDERRRAEAQKVRIEAERAEREAEDKHPLVRQAAERNAQLGKALASLVARLEAANAERTQAAERGTQIESDFENARQRVGIAGLNPILGQVLRDQRNRLPDLRIYRRLAAEREQLLAETGLAQLQYTEERRQLADVDAAVRARLDGAAEPLDDAARSRIASELKPLLVDRQALLDKLASAASSYLRALGDVDFEQRQLVDKAGEYADFLDRHLLWIPSAPPLGWQTLRNLPPAVAWALSPTGWIDTAAVLLDEARRAPLGALGLVLAVGVLVWLRRGLAGRLREIASQVGKVATDRFMLTVRAVALSIAAAAPVPLVMLVVGWRLESSVVDDEFVRALGTGLRVTALFVFLTHAFLRLLRDDGVMAVHFRWRDQPRQLLRHHLRWFLAMAGPALFVAAAVAAQSDADHRASLARLAFMLTVAALVFFTQRVLSPSSGVVHEALDAHPDGWLSRLRWLWYPLAIGTPLALLVLAGIGYVFTAGQLLERLFVSIGLVVAAIVVHDLVVRALSVARRRLEYQRVRERRLARLRQEEPETDADGTAVVVEAAEVDLAVVDEQTRGLLRTLIGISVLLGLWLAWAAVLPALAILDQVTLWQTSAVQDGAQVLAPITLADLLLALTLGVLGIVAARNVPGVLEIGLLQRLPLDAGSRYAISTVCQYIIAAIAISTVAGSLGISWGNVQWLVAALGVGLGFGLQEIFANFVSGLIILFERPVRIGDTVTVGSVSGTVSRIKIRATTITDWDRKEIIVPNKTFITEQLINWTLTDPITRVVIPVGVAYGTDTQKAYDVIKSTAERNPLVLDEPPLQVFFLGLGDSALNFELRVFVRELGDRLMVTHQLLMAIERALRENGIEIPFPQRDIHVRSFTWPTGFAMSPAGKPDAEH
ncbi:MAG: mechanosensitive ion channel [Ectothiorhodospiraceae bacterium]|nr:mechanosensitive ion channel [Chromatiales bacterium]MCP5154453.1 mechanosensitive ion channel [Ectothiorhodospiraceae bacterium]